MPRVVGVGPPTQLNLGANQDISTISAKMMAIKML